MIVRKIVHLKGNKKAIQGTFFLESSTNYSTRNKMRSAFAFNVIGFELLLSISSSVAFAAFRQRRARLKHEITRDKENRDIKQK